MQQTKKQEIIIDDFKTSKPNKFIRPLEYQKWKIIGDTFNLSDEKFLGKKVKPFKEFFYRFCKSFSGIFGLLIFVFIVLGAIILPFTTTDPTQIDPYNKYFAPFSRDTNGTYHILGTDSIGRDMWAMLWHGLRFSLGLALIVALADLVIGVTIGLLMGYYEKFDYVMQFVIKVLNNVPTIIIMILAMIVLTPSFWVLVMSMVLTGWVSMANQIRAQIKRGKNFQWVIASRVLGTKSYKIILNFIPLVIPMILTQLVFTIPGVVLSEAGLSFIGLSLPNTASLGNIINEGTSIITLYPRYVLIPSTALIFLTTSIQLMGNATQDALRRQR